MDWTTWYLTDEEDAGQTVEQSSIRFHLLSALGQLAVERGWNVLLSGDNFFAWIREEPLVRVSPDAYLLDDPPPPPRPKSWQTWLPGHKPPRWAVEVVSEEWKKDYEDNPPKYAQLGAKELVIFDPDAQPTHDPRGRVPLQVYRRGADGAFLRTYRGEGPARSEEIDAYLVVDRSEGAPRLRVARDPAGNDRVLTAEERVLAEAQAKRAAEARALVEADARRVAEEQVRALQAELAKLRGG